MLAPTTGAARLRGAAPVAAALALHVGFLLAYAAAFAGDPSAFVCADRGLIGRWPYEAVTVGFPTPGFDGQFYYVLARDPWHRAGSCIDLPCCRHCRLLYPALAWLCSGGDPSRLLWVLPLINLLAIGGLAWLGAALAGHYGRSPWWGFVLTLAVNAGAPALRNLTDPLATLAAGGLLAAWLLHWRPSALVAWAVAAVLSREQNVAVVGIVLLGAVSGRRWRSAAGLVGALLIWLGWVGILRGAYGCWPTAAGNVGVPLAGLYYRWTHLGGSLGAGRLPIHAVAMLHLSLQIGLSLALPWLRAGRTATLVALAGAALALLSGPPIYANGQSYTRVFLWMPLAIWLWSVQSGRRWPLAVLLPAALWPCVGILQVWWH
jgi:hypothetical protein